MITRTLFKLLFWLCAVFSFQLAAAQAPNISYPSPQVYTINQSINPVLPVNSGGAVTGTSASTVIALTFNMYTHVFTVDGAGNIYVADPFSNTIEVHKVDGSTSTIKVGVLHPYAMAVDRGGKYLYSIDYLDLSIWKTDLMTGTASKFSSETSNDIAVDASGNIYLIQQTGIVKLLPDGSNKTTISPAFKYYGGAHLAVNAAGTLVYWTNAITNEVFQLNTLTHVVTTIAVSTPLYQMYASICTDDEGNLYGINTDASVEKFDALTLSKTTLLATRYGKTKGTGPFANNFVPLRGINLALDNSGNIYLLDADNNIPQIEKISNLKYSIDKPLPAGLVFDTETGQISGTPTTGSAAATYTITAYNASGNSITTFSLEVKDPLAASPPKISYPTPNVYSVNQAIVQLVPVNTGGLPTATTSLTTLINNLNYSTAIATDASGNVYINSSTKKAIEIIAPNGSRSSLNISVSYPYKLAVDRAGKYLYGVDYLTSNLWKIDIATGSAVNIGSGNNYLNVTTDAAGNVYALQKQGIEKITPNGQITTINLHSFSFIPGIAVNAAGTTLYYTEPASTKIYQVDVATGQISSFSINLPNFGTYTALTAANDGSLYFAANGQFLLYKYDISTGTLTKSASNTPGDAVDLETDNNGNVYMLNATTYNQSVEKVSGSKYTIDKPLPAGLVFDPATGIISGTPTVASPATNYTVTAYNSFGSSSAIVNIKVNAALQPSIINFPPPTTATMDLNGALQTDATSTNNETPITYTSSNPDVAYVGNDGNVYVIDIGYTTITAYQKGNDNYLPATPVPQFYTFKLFQVIDFPAIATKSTCDVSFSANALSNSDVIPLTYTSSNPAVATVSATGQITILAPGTVTITANQDEGPLYIKAQPVSRTFTVVPLITPSLTITPTTYDKCQGENLLFTANPVNAGTKPTYQWSVNGINAGSNQATFNSSTLKTGDVVTCIVTNNDGCKPVASAVSNTATVTINPNISITASISSSTTGAVLSGVPVTFTAAITPATGPQLYYNWQVNGISTGGNSPTFTSSTLADKDVVSCTITATGKCVITPSVNTNTIMVHINTQRIAEIVIPNTFTPNGDGVNDVWNIPGLLAYNDCNMTIYNRYGEAVHQSIGYRQPWDGTKNGSQVPTGVYYYIINFRNSSAVLSGSITVLR
ncbi:hypothetical protein GCM10027037_29190 [Mucilaginibacter koreensis]